MERSTNLITVDFYERTTIQTLFPLESYSDLFCEVYETKAIQNLI